MSACLDPEVSVKSPSIELRVLTGIALLALAPNLASTFDSWELLDTTGDAGLVDAGSAVELLGLGGIVRQVFGDGMELDTFETGSVFRAGSESLRQLFSLIVRFFR